MSSTNPPGTAVIPPVSQPVVDAHGNITTPWWSFLYSLYTRTGSNTQVQSNTLASAVATATTLATSAESLAAEALAMAQGLAETSLTFTNAGVLAGTASTLNAIGGGGATFTLSGTQMELTTEGGIYAGSPPANYTTLGTTSGLTLSGTSPNLTLTNTGILAFAQGTITTTGTISLGGGLVLGPGTLQSRPYAPLVNGTLPGPAPIADGLGQFIMIEI